MSAALTPYCGRRRSTGQVPLDGPGNHGALAYENTGETWPLDVAALAHKQGFDWRGHFENFKFPEKMKAQDCILDTHVVNNAMAVKAPGVWYRQSRDAADAAALDTVLDTLDKYHGQITGILTGDEHYAGKSPSQGTELCAVVEYMFSLENTIATLGRAEYADRLERIAFNALPGTFSPDMWAHQYVQQANRVVCRVSEDRVYTNNGPDANLFGLEPNYGCCTANMHQAGPNLPPIAGCVCRRKHRVCRPGLPPSPTRPAWSTRR